jgi:hypothetical protein
LRLISETKLKENNDLNKSVELFGLNDKRMDTDPLDASHP